MARASTKVNQSFGTRLRKLRKEEGLSQEELAREVGIALKTISRIEVFNPDNSSFDTKTLEDIARVLGTTLPNLLEEKENQPSDEQLSWEKAYKESSDYLRDGYAVNLVVPKGSAIEFWIKNKLHRIKTFKKLGMVDMSQSAVTKREGFVKEALNSFGIPVVEIPDTKGEDLNTFHRELDKELEIHNKLLMTFLNFDFIKKSDYCEDHFFFAFIRTLFFGKEIGLLVHSFTEYEKLVPEGYMLSPIPFKTIYLEPVGNYQPNYEVNAEKELVGVY